MTVGKTIEDAELIRRHLEGDREAFPLLFARYEKGIFFLVRQFFPQTQLADEVFQEVFMKVIERLDRFSAGGSFRAWLWTLARNHCIDKLRYHKRRPEIPESTFQKSEDDFKSPIAQAPDTNTSPESATYHQELARHMDEVLAKLPPEQKETFLLKEQGGMTFEEIAEIMKVSVNTVKSRMRYALASLRRLLKNKAFIREAN